jgi:hypothetical protein
MTEEHELCLKYEPSSPDFLNRAWYRATFTSPMFKMHHELHAAFPWTRLEGAYPEYWTVAKAFFMETLFKQGLLWGPYVSFKLEVQTRPHDETSWTTVYYCPPAGEEDDNEEA